MTIVNKENVFVLSTDLDKLLGGTYKIRKSEDGNVIMAIEEETDKLYTLAIRHTAQVEHHADGIIRVEDENPFMPIKRSNIVRGG